MACAKRGWYVPSTFSEMEEVALAYTGFKPLTVSIASLRNHYLPLKQTLHRPRWVFTVVEGQNRRKTYNKMKLKCFCKLPINWLETPVGFLPLILMYIYTLAVSSCFLIAQVFQKDTIVFSPIQQACPLISILKLKQLPDT